MTTQNNDNKTVVIGLVGFIGSGKGTAGDILQSEFGFRNESFAAPLKDACSAIFGWDRELLEGQTVESRKFRETVDIFWSQKLGRSGFTPRIALQELGTDVIRNHFDPDIWISSLEYRIRKEHQGHNILLTDARFGNELDMIRRCGGILVRVKRGDDPDWMELAAKANAGDREAKRIMHHEYSDIHPSEWGWVGDDVHYVLENDSDIDGLKNKLLAYIGTLPQKDLIYKNLQKS